MKRWCFLLSSLVVVPGFICAMEEELGALEHGAGDSVVITIADAQSGRDVREENFGDFLDKPAAPGAVVVDMDKFDAEHFMHKYGLRSRGYEEELKQKLSLLQKQSPGLSAGTKGHCGRRGKSKDSGFGLSEEKVHTLIIEVLDDRIAKLDEKIKQEAEVKEKKEQEISCLKVWNVANGVVGWGAQCCLGVVVGGGTLAALALTIAQAATAK